MMDALEKEIKNFIEQQTLLGSLGRRDGMTYPTEVDLYRYLVDDLRGDELKKMLSHLKVRPETQDVVIAARKLILDLGQEQKISVPEMLLARVQAQIPGAQQVVCPHCKQAITPFKKPLSIQKMTNLLWLGFGIILLSMSFVMKHFFVQWTVAGGLCIAKWIVDQKATKTQIMIYKALSDEGSNKTHHLHRVDSHL